MNRIEPKAQKASAVTGLDDCRKLDASDPMAGLSDRFLRGDAGVIYLDANSLGPTPSAAPARVSDLIEGRWAGGRSQSWGAAGWVDAPERLGAKLARLIGAKPEEVIVGDGTSVNLFKLLVAALELRAERQVILTERDNFPSDLHIAQGIARIFGDRYTVRMLEPGEDIKAAIDESVAVVTLTHASFRSGACHDMKGITEKAHEAGALTVWDISHSTGATWVDLSGDGVDFAVGCGYKYLGGGPGSPAFAYVRRDLQEAAQNPLSGWMSHADIMAFDPDYRPIDGIRRFLCGSPEVLALSVFETALEVWDDVEPEVAHQKTRRLTGLFISLVKQELAGHGIGVVTPEEDARRGGQVTLAHPEGEAITNALVEAGVYCSFRPPNAIRFGFQPFPLSYEDVWQAVSRLRGVMEARS